MEACADISVFLQEGSGRQDLHRLRDGRLSIHFGTLLLDRVLYVLSICRLLGNQLLHIFLYNL